jgi:hypothetical protein
MRPTGRDLASSPEATLDELLAAATEYPEEVLANPALPLLALEDPAAYERIRREALASQARLRVEAALARLGDRRRRLFAADCAERVLRYFEAQFPKDQRPRASIYMARQFAAGRASRKELALLARAAYLASDYRWVEVLGKNDTLPAYAASAARECCDPDALRAARGAAEITAREAAAFAAEDRGQEEPASPVDVSAELAERAWQLECLAEYLAEGAAESAGHQATPPHDQSAEE